MFIKMYSLLLYYGNCKSLYFIDPKICFINFQVEGKMKRPYVCCDINWSKIERFVFQKRRLGISLV